MASFFPHNTEEPAHCKQFHWKCRMVLLWDNWVWAESGEGYQASRNSAVPFRTLIILIISQQRVWVEHEAVGFCLSLAKKKLCLLLLLLLRWEKKKDLFHLGGPAWTSGPWKLSNNNAPPAKSPHLFGCTTLSWWFLSICSPAQLDIRANHHDCYHQRRPSWRADLLNSTPKEINT